MPRAQHTNIRLQKPSESQIKFQVMFHFICMMLVTTKPFLFYFIENPLKFLRRLNEYNQHFICELCVCVYTLAKKFSIAAKPQNTQMNVYIYTLQSFQHSFLPIWQDSCNHKAYWLLGGWTPIVHLYIHQVSKSIGTPTVTCT